MNDIIRDFHRNAVINICVDKLIGILNWTWSQPHEPGHCFVDIDVDVPVDWARDIADKVHQLAAHIDVPERIKIDNFMVKYTDPKNSWDNVKKLEAHFNVVSYDEDYL